MVHSISHRTQKHHSAFGLDFEVGSDCRRWWAANAFSKSQGNRNSLTAKRVNELRYTLLDWSPSNAAAAKPHTPDKLLHWQTNAAKWKCLEFQLNYHWIDEFGNAGVFCTFRVRRAQPGISSKHKQWTLKLTGESSIFIPSAIEACMRFGYIVRSIPFAFGKSIEFVDETALAAMGYSLDSMRIWFFKWYLKFWWVNKRWALTHHIHMLHIEIAPRQKNQN